MTRSSPSAIAIVGLAGLFPQAANIRDYWHNILTGRNCITEVPPSRWDIHDYYDPDPMAPDKTYSKYGGFLPDVDFDPVAFGLPPSILEVTDTSQLLALLVAQKLLDDAGYGEQSSFDHTRTAVILGVSVAQKLITPLTSRLQFPVWEQVLRASGLSDEQTNQIVERLKKVYVDWEENAFPGLLGNVVAGRIANRFNLGGTNCAVDAACASSLGALQLAMNELAEGKCDMALTGGVDTDNSPFMYLCFSKTRAFSAHTSPKPFDKDADGTVIGEGIGMLLLKRLADAERDGDSIFAVVRGVGSSSDGRHASIYAPVVEGQMVALERAYSAAGISPCAVGLVEAHGTGTVAGDAAEVTALRNIFEQAATPRQTVALGSVKSQIGHTKAAAGVAGLIKAALALHHKVIPPTINVTVPHSSLNLEDSPFYLSTETRPWIVTGTDPRYAAVSSFGFGGTNYHVILEEYQREPTAAYRLNEFPHPCILVADNPEALRERCEVILAHLYGDQSAAAYADLLAASVTPALEYTAARVGCVMDSLDDARDKLKIAVNMLHSQPESNNWQREGVYYRRRSIPPGSKVVAVFAGQGSQYPGMGNALTCSFPELRRLFGAIDAYFQQEGEQPLSSSVFPLAFPGSTDRAVHAATLQRTEYAQPAIGAFCAGLYKVLCGYGFQPDMVAGHSFGELTALWAASALNDDVFLSLARARGCAMAAPRDKGSDVGAMLAVVGAVEHLQYILETESMDVALVNWNAPNQVVIAGPTSAIEAAQVMLPLQGYGVIRLPVSAAFHTSLIDYAREPFAHALQAAIVDPPQLPIYSNITAKCYPSKPDAIKQMLQRQMFEPVQFQQQITQMADDGGYVFVEFGPGDTLTRLIDAILVDRPHLAMALQAGQHADNAYQFQVALVQLHIAGVPIHLADRYHMPEPMPLYRQEKMAVRLSGSNYISEATRMRQEQALQSSKSMSSDAPQATNQPDPLANQHTSSNHNHTRSAALPVDLQAQVATYHQETQRVYEKLIDQQAATTTTLADLIRQQQSVLLDHLRVPVEPGTLDVLQRGLALLRDEQTEARQHAERYLKTRAASLQQIAASLDMQEEQMATVPAPTPVFSESADPPSSVSEPATSLQPLVAKSPDATSFDITDVLLELVSNKTGYPTSVLELDMELESDLGIDSIKRVQVLGTLQESYPDLPRLKAEEMGELRTLRQIIERVNTALKMEASTSLQSEPHAPPLSEPTSLPAAALTKSAVRIKTLPAPDAQMRILPEGAICLLTGDGTRLTAELAGQLAAHHWPLFLLQFPTALVAPAANLPHDLPTAVLTDLSADHLAETLQIVQQRYGPIGAFIHLHPPSASTAGEQIIRHVFLLARHLHQPLTRAATVAQAWFFTVTRMDGVFGMEQSVSQDPTPGGLPGLVKSLNLEWEHVFCRALDIALDDAPAVEAIVAELFDPNRLLVEVGYGRQGRCTRIGESLSR